MPFESLKFAYSIQEEMYLDGTVKIAAIAIKDVPYDEMYPLYALCHSTELGRWYAATPTGLRYARWRAARAIRKHQRRVTKISGS